MTLVIIGTRRRGVTSGMVVDEAIHFIYRIEKYERLVSSGSIWGLGLGAVFDAPA
jgi:hypothetical protein